MDTKKFIIYALRINAKYMHIWLGLLSGALLAINTSKSLIWAGFGFMGSLLFLINKLIPKQRWEEWS